jgi:hypothetical protein
MACAWHSRLNARDFATSNDGVVHETVQLEFVLLSAMVSRHAAPIAARRDLVGSAGTFKLSRISAATILKLLNAIGVGSHHPPTVVPAGTLIGFTALAALRACQVVPL